MSFLLQIGMQRLTCHTINVLEYADISILLFGADGRAIVCGAVNMETFLPYLACMDGHSISG